MSDESLLRGLRSLRRERGITIPVMLSELRKAGLTFIHEMRMDWPLTNELLGRLERLSTCEELPEWVSGAGRQLAPALRKVLTNM